MEITYYENECDYSLSIGELNVVCEIQAEQEECREICDAYKRSDESIVHISGSPCGSWGFLSKETGEVKRFFCGNRKCPREICGKIFHWRRVRLLDALVREYDLGYFFTLTMEPREGRADKYHWELIPKVWNKFLTMLRRRYKGIKFVAILEKHKENERPHIHGFWNKWVDWNWTREKWENCGGGKGLWLDKVCYGNVTEYVTKALDVSKYVGKDQVAGIPGYAKRTLWRSQKMKAEFELTKDNKYIIVKEKVFDFEGKQILEVSRKGDYG